MIAAMLRYDITPSEQVQLKAFEKDPTFMQILIKAGIELSPAVKKAAMKK